MAEPEDVPMPPSLREALRRNLTSLESVNPQDLLVFLTQTGLISKPPETCTTKLLVRHLQERGNYQHFLRLVGWLHQGGYSVCAEALSSSLRYPSAVRRELPKRIKRNVGANVTLSCQFYPGNPPPVFKWKKDGAAVHFRQKASSSQSSVTLNQLALADSGVYTCTAENSAGAVSSECTLTVHDIEDNAGYPPLVLKPLSDHQVDVKDNVTLSCLVDLGIPPAKITWFCSGKEIAMAKSMVRADGLVSYKMASVQKAAEGMYRCQVTNEHGTAFTSCLLQVFNNPPKLVDQISNTAMQPLREIMLSCTFHHIQREHDPVRWLYNKSPVENNPQKMEAECVRGVATLIIRDYTNEDSGTYTCVARNQFGQCQTECQLVIAGEAVTLDSYKGLKKHDSEHLLSRNRIRLLQDLDVKNTMFVDQLVQHHIVSPRKAVLLKVGSPHAHHIATVFKL